MTDWTRARCLAADPDLFFPDKGALAEPARAICRGCPIRRECLQLALDNDERYGVWGGLDARERMALRRSSRRGRWSRYVVSERRRAA